MSEIKQEFDALVEQANAVEDAVRAEVGEVTDRIQTAFEGVKLSLKTLREELEAKVEGWRETPTE